MGRFVLFISDRDWTLGSARDQAVSTTPLDFPPDADLTQRAERAYQALVALGYTGDPVVVAIPSQGCVCCTISTHDLDRKGRRRAMAYRLEEHLPVSAEQFTSDFIESGTGHALGACVETERLLIVVQALETHGIAVGPIVPAAVLAASHFLKIGGVRDAQLLMGPDTVAAIQQTGLDGFSVSHGRLVRWQWFSGRDDLPSNWDHHPEPSGPLKTFGSVGAVLGIADPADSEPCTPSHAAVLFAASVLDGKAEPVLNFRRDAIASSRRGLPTCNAFTALAVAMVALLVTVSFVFLWRGRVYEGLTRDAAVRQAVVFESLFEGHRIPGAVLTRLRSERAKFASLSGGDASVGAAVSDAIEKLAEVLASLPADLRFRILELNIGQESIRIEGQARSHGDAEKLTSALRATGSYEVDPPRTQTQPQGEVSFTLMLQTHKPAEPITSEVRP